MKRKILNEFQVDKYKVLGLDGELPTKEYSHYKIDGNIYGIVPLYDMPNCIAIEASGIFSGKTVEFQ